MSLGASASVVIQLVRLMPTVFVFADTKVVTQDALRSKTSDQKDFRDEALKTKVRTKTMSQDDYKTMHAEQKDFRGETIKSKVVTKAYREETIKVIRCLLKVFALCFLSPTFQQEICDDFDFC